ncbi:MAG: hypothetical protein LUQ25_01425 [Methanoregulaceae archaeon]|nr:hypothetical protein [Methanoregulaceae archaeon]
MGVLTPVSRDIPEVPELTDRWRILYCDREQGRKGMNRDLCVHALPEKGWKEGRKEERSGPRPLLYILFRGRKKRIERIIFIDPGLQALPRSRKKGLKVLFTH